MKTTITIKPLAFRIKNFFTAKASPSRDSQSSEKGEVQRSCPKEREEYLDRQLDMEILRAEASELRRVGFLSTALLIFGPLYLSFPLAVSIGKEVIAL